MKMFLDLRTVHVSSAAYAVSISYCVYDEQTHKIGARQLRAPEKREGVEYACVRCACIYK